VERVVIAELGRPRGNKGEITAASLTDVPGRLENLKRASVTLPDGTDEPVTVEKAWFHTDHWVLKFSGVDTIEAAGRFRGADLWIPRDNRGQLPEGQYFQSDLLGCLLVTEAGEPVGTVEDFADYGGPLLLQLTVKGREVLVPFVPEICRQVDLERKRIAVSLPEGLLDLNP
jgi:16S rRNA processing protein RimM